MIFDEADVRPRHRMTDGLPEQFVRPPRFGEVIGRIAIEELAVLEAGHRLGRHQKIMRAPGRILQNRIAEIAAVRVVQRYTLTGCRIVMLLPAEHALSLHDLPQSAGAGEE